MPLWRELEKVDILPITSVDRDWTNEEKNTNWVLDGVLEGALVFPGRKTDYKKGLLTFHASPLNFTNPANQPAHTVHRHCAHFQVFCFLAQCPHDCKKKFMENFYENLYGKFFWKIFFENFLWKIFFGKKSTTWVISKSIKMSHEMDTTEE